METIRDLMVDDHRQCDTQFVAVEKALAAGDSTTIYYGEGNRLLGAVAVADTARASSAASLSALRDNGVTGSIGQRVKRMFAKGPLSKEDRESIEDESRVRER